MSELDYIGAGELVFNNDKDHGIYSGGFSVNSIMMKAGMSPIMTVNNVESLSGGGDYNKVSDLFNDLVVPNWALSYNNRIGGGKYKEVEHDDSDSEDSVIDDDLHDKLLELVKEHNANVKEKESLVSKKKMTRRMKKADSKKRGTKRRK
jgi:hypothetical protein